MLANQKNKSHKWCSPEVFLPENMLKNVPETKSEPVVPLKKENQEPLLLI